MDFDEDDDDFYDPAEDIFDPIEERKIVGRSGTFSVELVPQSTWIRSPPNTDFPAYEKVLRPILDVATECWVYGMKRTSTAFRAAKGLFEPEKGKWQVKLDGDPIGGHRLFWNGSGWLRGTIVILVPRHKFDPVRLFRGCNEAFVFENFLSGHTPAAIRFARDRIAKSDVVAVCLPASNGIEWMDIHAKPRTAVAMLEMAGNICGRK